MKKLKELLKTNYILQKSDDRLCIGSAYIHDLISIDRDTLEIKLRDSIRGFRNFFGNILLLFFSKRLLFYLVLLL